MKEIRNIPQLSIVRVLYICILIVHLLMLAMGVNAQSVKQELLIKAGTAVHPADPRISRVREIYTSQIGVREKGSNSGREVEEYLRYVNLPKGNPWCAAFVCWVLGKAGVGNPGTGWSPGLFPESNVIWEQGTRSKEQGLPHSVPHGYPERRDKKERHTIPTTADIFGIYFSEKGRIAHVGFIDEWNDSWVVTVEGNTNVVGRSLSSLGMTTGDGVYRKRRLVRSVYKVVRYL